MKEIIEGIVYLLAAAFIFLMAYFLIGSRAYAYDSVTCAAGVCTYTITAETNDIRGWSEDSEWPGPGGEADGFASNEASAARASACFLHTGEYTKGRSFFEYDTTGIAGTVTSAENHLQSLNKSQDSEWVVLTGANGLGWTDSTLVEYCDRIQHVDWGSEVRHEIALNSAALVDLNSALGGSFYIGFLNADHDVDNIPPTLDQTAAGLYYADTATDSKRPKLVLTVTPPSGGEYANIW